MQINLVKIIPITLFTMLLASCGGQKTEEIDLSTLQLQLPPKKEKEITSLEEEKIINPLVLNELKPLINKDQLNSSIEFGRDDPFSSLEQEKNLELNNLKLEGLLLVNSTKYALIKYNDKSGSITSEALGGINTDLIPDGAKVKEIDIKRKILTIVIDQKTYPIYLD